MTKEQSDNRVAYTTNELYHRIVEGYSGKGQVKLEAGSLEFVDVEMAHSEMRDMSKEVYPGGSFGATRAGTADSNTVQHPPAQGDDMQPGEALYADQSIWSANGRFRFIYQLDGNLVLYGPGGAFWDSKTTGRDPGVCIMQTDGNLVMSGPGGVAIRDSNTHNNPGSRLLVRDDGNVVIYRPNGVPIWQTSGPTPQRVRLTLSRRFDIPSYTHNGLLNISSGKVKSVKNLEQFGWWLAHKDSRNPLYWYDARIEAGQTRTTPWAGMYAYGEYRGNYGGPGTIPSYLNVEIEIEP